MPCTCRTRARGRPPRPAPTIVTVVIVMLLSDRVPAVIGTMFHESILEHRSIRVKMVVMANRAQRAERRTDALSRERIVEAAIGILDTAGEGGLTFRALTARLATGAGAIYWHVASKSGPR